VIGEFGGFGGFERRKGLDVEGVEVEMGGGAEGGPEGPEESSE